MIQKIQSNEYLKRLDNMTGAEREEYLNRVGEWLDKSAPLILSEIQSTNAVFQNVLEVSISWNADKCKAWAEGVVLLTALVSGGDTWLPDMLYTKAAKRAIKQMVGVIKNAVRKETEVVVAPLLFRTDKTIVTEEDKQRIIEKYTDKTSGTKWPSAGAGINPLPSGDKPAVVRPKHIDQYIHLLPKETQERAESVRGLLRDLDAARENLRLLMNDPSAGSVSRASWAEKAKNIDNKLKSIYKEIDSEWEKLVQAGVVSVDAFGNAVVNKPVETPETVNTDMEEKPTDVQEDDSSSEHQETPETETPSDEKKEEQEAQSTEKAAKAAEKEAKKKAAALREASLLRKFLIDKRNAKSDDQKKKWTKKYKEMVKLAGEAAVTDKVREAAVYYGIDIDKIK